MPAKRRKRRSKTLALWWGEVMGDAAIAQMIREILAEELDRIRPAVGGVGGAQRPSVREEWISISNDADLQSLVNKVLSLAGNDADRYALERGEIVFRLANANQAGGAFGERPTQCGGSIEVMSGIVSERQIDQLPAGTSRFHIGKAVRLTPLAKDRLRQRGIAIERMEQ